MVLKKNKKTFFIALFCLKMGLLFFLYNAHREANGSDVFYENFIRNDYSELLMPVNNLIEHGTYSYLSNDLKPYTDRIPGYMFPYVLFRFFLDTDKAIICLIAFQIVFAFLASCAFYEILYVQTKSRKWSAVGFTVLTMLHYMLPWDLGTAPESLSLSSFILFWFYLIKWKDFDKLKFLLLSGLFLAWTFFLRGFTAFYFFPVLVFIIYRVLKVKKQGFPQLLKALSFFFLSLFLMETAWVARNYSSKGEFIPLQSRFVGEDQLTEIAKDYPFKSSFKPSVVALRELIAQWGGNNIRYYTNSEMAYFFADEQNPSIEQYFPQRIFLEEFKPDLIKNIRKDLRQSYQVDDFEENQRLERALFRKIKEAKEIFKKVHGFDLYAPFNRVKNLVVNNIVIDWPGKSFKENGLLYKGLKLIVLTTYAFILISGFIAIILVLFRRRKDHVQLVLLSQFLLLLITFAFFVDTAEMKYFSTGIFLLLFAMMKELSNFEKMRLNKRTKKGVN